MTYVMSDLHGQYQKHLQMLETIHFTDNDDLYILGDVVDRGPQSAELLYDMSMRMNVFPILGNHDMLASIMLKKLCVEITEDNYSSHIDLDTINLLAAWQMDGGQETLKSFKKLSSYERDILIEYMDEFMPYAELEVREKRFILVHGGIPYEKRKNALEDQIVEELITERPDYSKRYFENKDTYLVTGHTPTVNIGEQWKGKIFQSNGHIAIDCGAGFGIGMPLGCIRLEDFSEFYVD